MISGEKYKVIFQIPGVHKKPRVAVMKFLGTSLHHYYFDLRPLAGTQEVEKKHVLHTQLTVEDLMVPKIYDGPMP